MVAGVVSLVLGLKKTLGDVGEPPKPVPAVAILGGVADYLVVHVAFRWRNVHRFSYARLTAAALLVALIPVALKLPEAAGTATPGRREPCARQAGFRPPA